MDASAEDGVDYNISSNAEDIPWTPKSVQEVVFHLDANDSNSITLSENDVAEWADLSGNGYDMIAQGHPTREDYGYGTDLKVVRFEKSGRDALYSTKNGIPERVILPCLPWQDIAVIIPTRQK